MTTLHAIRSYIIHMQLYPITQRVKEIINILANFLGRTSIGACGGNCDGGGGGGFGVGAGGCGGGGGGDGDGTAATVSAYVAVAAAAAADAGNS